MSKTAIITENLGKIYRIGATQKNRRSYSTLRDSITDLVSSPFAKKTPKNDEMIWALKNVSFEIKESEVVGVIGRNGAGKTTLLKILSRITEPTEGFAEINGRVRSLLEVGTGFHPELTGRENIFLNGAILGMKRTEIDRKFDEIVAFAEIEKFIDTPVKFYSSGMYVRLAFAVAAHLEPEIMIVDEVLAVGDVAFQKKCLGKMSDVADQGRTVLFVSHNMGAIRSLCERVILLANGELAHFGSTNETITKYLSNTQSSNASVIFPDIESDAFYTEISVQNSAGVPTKSVNVRSPFKISFRYRLECSIKGLEVSFAIYDRYESKLFYCTHDSFAYQNENEYRQGKYISSVAIPGNFLAPGFYSVVAVLHRPRAQLFDRKEHIIGFEVIESGSGHYAFGEDVGSILVDFKWNVRRLN